MSNINKNLKSRSCLLVRSVNYWRAKMTEFLQQYWTGVLFGGIVATGGAGFKHLRCKIKEIEVIKEGVLAINADRLEHLCERALESEFATTNYRRKLDRLFSAYQKLGGNGYLAEMVEDVYNLPYSL